MTAMKGWDILVLGSVWRMVGGVVDSSVGTVEFPSFRLLEADFHRTIDATRWTIPTTTITSKTIPQ
jgi:hypothetical protein